MFVFVYGTLKSGQPNNYLIKDETRGNGTWIGKAKTNEKYPLVVASRYNVPYLLHKPGTGQNVEGEIYEVDEALLLILDDLEKHPIYYQRKEVGVRLLAQEGDDSNSRIISCHSYFLVQFVETLLELPMLTSYHDQINGLQYVKPTERPPGRYWWYEVHSGHDKPDESNVTNE